MTATANEIFAIVGAGRMGTALHRGLTVAGRSVLPLQGRGYDGAEASVVLLTVPDEEIATAARLIRPGPVLGHCSGATGLSGLGPRDAFSLHPLMTVTDAPVSLRGVPAAAAANTDRARAVADDLAETLGLTTFVVADEDRVAYHAGAAMAANFLITLQWAASRLLASAAVAPEVVLPLARAALENWAAVGPQALTGPVARGDETTVAAHRAAVRERTPDLLPLFDSLVAATKTMLP